MSITIPPFGSATIKVRFKPTAVGERTGQLNFTSNTPASPHTVQLVGEGKDSGGEVPNPKALRDTMDQMILDSLGNPLESF